MKNSKSYWVFECQIPDEVSGTERIEATNALLKFSLLMKCPCRQVQNELSFVVELPDEEYECCQMINAFEAFFPLYNIVHSLHCYSAS